MDRKGWIILILCGIALMFNYQISQKNAADRRKLDEKEKALNEKEAQSVSKPKAEAKAPASADAATPAPAKPVVVKEDHPVVLTGKDGDADSVRYTFTNFGGGVKFAEVLGQYGVKSGKQIEHTDQLVKVNGDSELAVGTLADDPRNIAPVYYEVVDKGANYVTYKGTLPNGVVVTKKWTVENADAKKPSRLRLDLSFTVPAGKNISLGKYALLTGSVTPLYGKEQRGRIGFYYYEDGDYQHDNQSKFKGGMFSGEDKEVKHYDKLENLEYIGVDNQFFTTSIIPIDSKVDHFWAKGKEIKVDGVKRWKFLAGLSLPDKNLSGDSSANLAYTIYMGPKKDKLMPNLSENSDDIMNYSSLSFFSWISGGMNWMLNFIHGWFPEDASWSWGAAIILLTFFIRLLIWPLTKKSTLTMKRMSKLQPIMKELKEKYADNPQKLNQETMKLYREYGVNPMGGCLPMFVQIPIFFGVFNMITGAVELRGQSFLWVKDLSLPDTIGFMPITGWPINLLPILMAITMVIQMRMTPQTGDKMQRRIFMFMPLMFFFICYNYAAALALYWTTQNIISIFQTWHTQRLPEPELVKKTDRRKGKKGAVEVMDDKPRKKGFMERLAEKLEEAQNQRDAAAGVKPAAKKKTAATKKAKVRTPKTGG